MTAGTEACQRLVAAAEEVSARGARRVMLHAEELGAASRERFRSAAERGAGTLAKAERQLRERLLVERAGVLARERGALVDGGLVLEGRVRGTLAGGRSLIDVTLGRVVPPLSRWSASATPLFEGLLATLGSRLRRSMSAWARELEVVRRARLATARSGWQNHRRWVEEQVRRQFEGVCEALRVGIGGGDAACLSSSIPPSAITIVAIRTPDPSGAESSLLGPSSSSPMPPSTPASTPSSRLLPSVPLPAPGEPPLPSDSSPKSPALGGIVMRGLLPVPARQRRDRITATLAAQREAEEQCPRDEFVRLERSRAERLLSAEKVWRGLLLLLHSAPRLVHHSLRPCLRSVRHGGKLFCAFLPRGALPRRGSWGLETLWLGGRGRSW